MVEVGKEYITKKGDKFLVIEKLNKQRCKIKFLDEFEYEKEVSNQSITIGDIRNPYYKSVRGVGYIGIGEYNSKSMGGKIYNAWTGVLDRCYSEKWKLKYPTYRFTTVCKEWLNFQNFAEWYYKNYPHHIKDIKFELDKDLKQLGISNKIYSPQTCVIIPKRVNGFMVNVQSSNKSGHAGIFKLKHRKNRWVVSVSDRTTKNSKKLGMFNNIEDAIKCYNEYREKMSEELKNWVRGLNYIDEEVI